jgi:hypothetical protein
MQLEISFKQKDLTVTPQTTVSEHQPLTSTCERIRPSISTVFNYFPFILYVSNNTAPFKLISIPYNTKMHTFAPYIYLHLAESTVPKCMQYKVMKR